MNENSSPPVSVDIWLHDAIARLKTVGIPTARLDALVLLTDAIGRDKAWLLAHPEATLDASQIHQLQSQLTQRANRVPLAYIREKQEFFGRKFHVTPAVLIPRPETETLVELFLELDSKQGDVLADIGTGSGAIAITVRLERPSLTVFATDTSSSALAVACNNATTLGATTIHFIHQDLLTAPLPQPVRFIVANLPYVSHDWQRSVETEFEPPVALFAEDNGLALIKKLIQQSLTTLLPQGYLLLEADPRQHQQILAHANQYNYRLTAARDFCICLQRG